MTTSAIPVRSLSVTAVVDPAKLPHDVVAPAGHPAGDVLLIVLLQGGQGLPARLNGKNYRRLLGAAATSGPGIGAHFQASLQAIDAAPGIGLVNAGFRLAPSSREAVAFEVVGTNGPGAPAVVRFASLEASVSIEASLVDLSGEIVLQLDACGIPVRFAEAPAAEWQGTVVLKGQLATGLGGAMELRDARVEPGTGSDCEADPEPSTVLSAPAAEDVAVKPAEKKTQEETRPTVAQPGPVAASVSERPKNKAAGGPRQQARPKAPPARPTRRVPRRPTLRRNPATVVDCEAIVRGIIAAEVAQVAAPFIEQLQAWMDLFEPEDLSHGSGHRRREDPNGTRGRAAPERRRQKGKESRREHRAP